MSSAIKTLLSRDTRMSKGIWRRVEDKIMGELVDLRRVTRQTSCSQLFEWHVIANRTTIETNELLDGVRQQRFPIPMSMITSLSPAYTLNIAKPPAGMQRFFDYIDAHRVSFPVRAYIHITHDTRMLSARLLPWLNELVVPVIPTHLSDPACYFMQDMYELQDSLACRIREVKRVRECMLARKNTLVIEISKQQQELDQCQRRLDQIPLALEELEAERQSLHAARNAQLEAEKKGGVQLMSEGLGSGSRGFKKLTSLKRKRQPFVSKPQQRQEGARREEEEGGEEEEGARGRVGEEGPEALQQQDVVRKLQKQKQKKKKKGGRGGGGGGGRLSGPRAQRRGLSNKRRKQKSQCETNQLNAVQRGGYRDLERL